MRLLTQASKTVFGIGNIRKLGSRTQVITEIGNSLKAKEITIPVPWGKIAVLCVHGWQDNAATFDKLIPLLSRENYFVSVDLQGHGLSSHLPPGMAYHYFDFLSTLRRVVKHFNWTKFSWLGHSLGGPLGTMYDSIFESEIQNLVSIDLAKPPSGNESIAEMIRVATDYYLSNESKLNAGPPMYTFEEACQRLLKGTDNDNDLTEESAKILLSRGLRQVSPDRWAFTKDFRLRSRYIVTMSRLSDQQCKDILRNMKCRMMFIKGLDSTWYYDKETRDEFFEVYRSSCASFELVEVPGTHFVHLNNPERIADKINKFLNHPKSNES